MKTIIIIMFSLISLAVHSQEAKLNRYTVKVDGLGCPFCAYGLEKKFKKLDGIADIGIDMETGIFTFSLPKGNPTSISEIEERVRKAGYTPISVKVLPEENDTDDNKTELQANE